MPLCASARPPAGCAALRTQIGKGKEKADKADKAKEKEPAQLQDKPQDKRAEGKPADGAATPGT
jgi:hypothetical protein